MLRIKRAGTDASRSDGRALFPVVALLATAAAIEYLLPGGGERSRVSSSVGSRAASEDDGRGRLAATPSEIPPRGRKDILLRVYSNVPEHRILALAAGMTYYSLLAIFPALAALVAVYGLFADQSAIAGQEYTRRHTDLVGDHSALLQLEIKRSTDQLLRRFDHLVGEQLHACIDIMEESIAARWCAAGYTSSEGAGDGVWLCPRRAFQPDA